MPRPYIPQALRKLVAARARYCCEYCGLHEEDAPDTHQFDHIIAVKHHGPTNENNLAYACAVCNRHKGSDFATLHPLTGEIVRLFHPRKQLWREHFAVVSAQIRGLTETGRLTAELFHFNDDDRLLERELLLAVGRYPPTHLRLAA
jgi:hypothetical protein